MIAASDGPPVVHIAPRKGIAGVGRTGYASGPMIDGYSVSDAASVLGVPEGRVWELLARGVLAGTPEGDSMRVFLKADAVPSPRPIPREELPRSNGNGGSHGAEASAFRELLTEFRNLTERYGQALLALGEARGEVAGLRSRVELLEARLDLRLPAAMDAAPIAWEAPAPRAPAPEPPDPADVEAVMPAPAPVQRTPRPRKARSTRAAVAGFAEALARAQDPNVADVATEQAAREAAPATEVVVEAVAAEADVAAGVDERAAEPAGPAEPAEPTYSAAVVEPDWFADGDFSWLDAADIEARSQTEMTAAAPAITPVELEVAAEATPEPDLEPAPGPMIEVLSQVEVLSQAEVEAEALPEVATEPEVAAEPEPAPVFEPVVPLGVMEPVELSGGGEEAVMWLGGPREAADEIEIAAAAHQEALPAPRHWDPLEPVAWPATDRGASVTQAVAPPLAMTEEELAQLARDEGWDDAEVEAIRAMISRPAPRAVQLPGAAELDEAMTALQAVPIGSQADASPRQWAKPATPGAETSGYQDWAFEVEPAPETPALQPPQAPRRAASDPNWLRQRRGPAASAYRRIRRIFTG